MSDTATEERLRIAFAHGGVITAKMAALVLGCDVKTLRKMTNAGLIGSRAFGERRAYSELDIRSYLERTSWPSTAEPVPSMVKKSRRDGGTTISKSEVIAFTAQLDSFQKERRNSTKNASAAKSHPASSSKRTK